MTDFEYCMSICREINKDIDNLDKEYRARVRSLTSEEKRHYVSEREALYDAYAYWQRRLEFCEE